MNVLVYSGPEVLNTSFARSVSLLKAILVPHYSVQPITLQSLTTNPWSDTCALLVFPACREQLSLPPPVRTGIKDFVERGGSFLGFRASGRISGSGFASLDLYESSLRFQDRSSGTNLSCTFSGDGSGTSTTVALKSSIGDTSVVLPSDHTPTEFSVPEGSTNVQTLALSGEDAAAIACRIGEGRVVLWGLDLTCSAGQDSADVESTRRVFLNETLQQLNLKLPEKENTSTMYPLPQILTSSPAVPDAVSNIFQSLTTKGSTLKDDHDTFSFHTAEENKRVLKSSRTTPPASETDVKHIIAYPDQQLPSPEDTPLFNLSRYYADLVAARSKANAALVQEDKLWGIGEVLLYGEVVTSTQTMLDKNHRFLSSLRHPLLSLASHQIAGRGRGGNNWVSPSGCLQFSLLLRIPLKDVPATKLVFIQYLFALAVVEACRSPDVLGSYGENVRIKWPNDLYVAEGAQKRKVGGILVHTSFQGGMTTIVIGCGINVLNTPPIASLSQLGSPERPMTMERTAATIMATFEPMLNTFISERGSFSSFMDLYLERWLHSDQAVTITSVNPHRPVRIVGITEDFGLLRTVPERRNRGEEYIDLQPDGNSFDLMSGLIMSKQ